MTFMIAAGFLLGLRSPLVSEAGSPGPNPKNPPPKPRPLRVRFMIKSLLDKANFRSFLGFPFRALRQHNFRASALAPQQLAAPASPGPLFPQVPGPSLSVLSQIVSLSFPSLARAALDQAPSPLILDSPARASASEARAGAKAASLLKLYLKRQLFVASWATPLERCASTTLELRPSRHNS